MMGKAYDHGSTAKKEKKFTYLNYIQYIYIMERAEDLTMLRFRNLVRGDPYENHRYWLGIINVKHYIAHMTGACTGFAAIVCRRPCKW